MAYVERLDKHVADLGNDDLIYDLYPPCEVFSVILATGEGVLKRGTVLAKKGAAVSLQDENSTPAADPDAENFVIWETGKTANCILCDDTELGTEARVAAAYRTGHFAQNKLIVKSGSTLTEQDKEDLREVGILLSESV